MTTSEIRHRSNRHATDESEENENNESATTKLVKNLKNLDIIHSKTAEEDNISIQTQFGGLITIITTCIIFILFISELYRYISITQSHSITVDTKSNKKLDIYFNITFPSLQCSKCGIDIMDISGESQYNSLKSIWKQRLEPGKWNIPIGEKFQDLHENDENEEEHDHNNHNENNNENNNNGINGNININGHHQDQYREGCNIYGYLTVAKVAGNFHMAIGGSHSANPKQSHVHGFSIEDMIQFNSSHIIHSIRFGQNLDLNGLIHPLDSTQQLLLRGSPAAHFQYFIKIVPTIYTNQYGVSMDSNYYSVTNHTQILTQMDLFRGDGRKIPGVFFIYDISPFLLLVKDKSMRLTEFLISCCAIVGGIVSIAGIVDSLVHYIGKAVVVQ